jgi:hypothetical protein
MNAKYPTGWGFIAVSIVIGVVPQVVMRWFDHSDTGPLQVSIAKLETQVANLTVQLSNFTGQPYVSRPEFNERLAGFDNRIRDIERVQQLRK